MKASGRKFPKHLGANACEWRQKKRQQWREVVKALDTYSYGAAYAPGGKQLFEIQRLVAQISEDMQGDWIEW